MGKRIRTCSISFTARWPTGSAASFAAPTPPQAQGWPAIARGESTLILAPTGSGKTLAAFLWRINRMMFDARRHAANRSARAAAASSTSRRSRRWRSTSSATCGRRSPASRNRAAARGDAVPRPGGRDPHRRHAGERARAVPARAGRHPDHDARVALPAADLERARGAALGRHGDHRRDPRAGADQARRAPGAVARAARVAHRDACRSASGCRRRSVRSTRWRGSSAARSTRDAARPTGATKARRARSPIPRTPIHDEFTSDRASPTYRPGHDRRHLAEEAARAADRGAGRGHGEDRRGRGDPERPGVAGPGRERRSGPPSIRGCSSWCRRTARR